MLLYSVLNNNDEIYFQSFKFKNIRISIGIYLKILGIGIGWNVPMPQKLPVLTDSDPPSLAFTSASISWMLAASRYSLKNVKLLDFFLWSILGNLVLFFSTNECSCSLFRSNSHIYPHRCATLKEIPIKYRKSKKMNDECSPIVTNLGRYVL